MQARIRGMSSGKDKRIFGGYEGIDLEKSIDGSGNISGFLAGCSTTDDTVGGGSGRTYSKWQKRAHAEGRLRTTPLGGGSGRRVTNVERG